MVCRLLDSFDTYASNDLGKRWNIVANGSINSSIIHTGPNVLSLGNGGEVERSFDDQATWIVGCNFRHFNGNGTIILFKDGTTIQCSLRLISGRILAMVRGSGTTVLGGNSTAVLNQNTWYHIEVKVTIANSISAGSCIVKLNGVTEITVDTGEDLQISGNATANSIRLDGQTAQSQYFDNVYIFDGSGSENNDFAGEVKIIGLLPNGNGATNEFVGSDADSTDNYLHVDEADTDEDTSYVESSTVSDIDLYAYDNLPETPDAIPAVQITSVCRKDDVGARTMRIVSRPVSTNYFGTGFAPSNVSYLSFFKVYDLNPETAAAWTETLLNASQFGIEIET